MMANTDKFLSFALTVCGVHQDDQQGTNTQIHQYTNTLISSVHQRADTQKSKSPKVKGNFGEKKNTHLHRKFV